MTENRLLALFVAACALAASALMALPQDGTREPAAEISAAELAPQPARLAAPRDQGGTEVADDVHAALPRLWLGSATVR